MSKKNGHLHDVTEAQVEARRAVERIREKNLTGAYGKFHVQRTDGGSNPGEKHERCHYFVLDLTHDPYAIPAIRAYAMACMAEMPALASDLITACSTRELNTGPDPRLQETAP